MERLLSIQCHLGHRLGPPTRGRPQILGQKLIYLKNNKINNNGDIGKKLVL